MHSRPASHRRDAPSGTVLVVGSANLDLVVRVARPPAVGETLLGEAAGRFPGGKGLNQAIAAARCGARTALVASVGDDEAAEVLRAALVAAGVAPRLSVSAERPTGVAHILALPDGDNAIVVAAGANGVLAPAAAVAEVAALAGDAGDGTAVVLAQLEVPVPVVEAALRAARDAGVVTVLNAAPAHPAAIGLLPAVDVLVVNETECAELGGVVALHAAGAACVVVTLGADGVEVHRADRDRIAVPAIRVPVVDTTGAGDAFCGALVAALAGGLDIAAAAERGVAAGAIAVQHLGATTDAIVPSAIDRLVGAMPR